MDEVQRISQLYKAFTDPSAFLQNLEKRDPVEPTSTPTQSVDDILSSHPPRRKKFSPPFEK